MSAVLLTALAIVLMLVAGEQRRLSRRRHALNQALHEIRRPLQVLVLLSPSVGGPVLATPRSGGRPAEASRGKLRISLTEPVLQVMSAVGDLDRALNGGPAPGPRTETIAARLMADACVRRWQSRAALSGGSIQLRWGGPDALLRGDGVALASALENLILNAIEHGGPEVTVTGRPVGRRIRIEVLDDGVAARPPGCPSSPAQTVAGLRGRGRHGHGLEVAGRIAADHAGRLETSFATDGSRAVLVLPRATRVSRGSSAVKVNW